MIWRIAVAAVPVAVAASIIFLKLSEAGEPREKADRQRRTCPAPNPIPGDACSLGEAEWRSLLPRGRYQVLRQKGTERAFTGAYWDHKEEGVYRCAACGQILFDSKAKFDSRSGWPSFYAPHAPESVRGAADQSHGMERTEVLCSRCGSHLGHVFDDGPRPTGQRYCINSAALKHQSADELARVRDDNSLPADGLGKAMFGAGCFWGVEAAFRKVPGVVDTAVGFSGGWKENPTYEQVCTDRTGHAEVVLVSYAPAKVTYAQLLKAFWRMHDPTQRDRQGPDIGRQYRSVVFYFNEEQKRAAEASRDALQRSNTSARPVATEITPASTFWRAEEHHQRFYEKRGIRGCVFG